MNEKPKRNKQSNSFLSALKYIFLLALLMFAFCGITLHLIRQDIQNSLIEASFFEATGNEAFNRIAKYNPPDSATDFYWYSSSHPFLSDYEHRMRFQLLSEDFERWLDSSGLCFDTLQDDFQMMSSSNFLTWWQPHTAEVFESGECGENPVYALLVDQTDSVYWIVYLQVWKW